MKATNRNRNEEIKYSTYYSYSTQTSLAYLEDNHYGRNMEFGYEDTYMRHEKEKALTAELRYFYLQVS